MRTRRIGASVPAALPEMSSEPMAPNLKQVAAPLGMFTPSYPRTRGIQGRRTIPAQRLIEITNLRSAISPRR